MNYRSSLIERWTRQHKQRHLTESCELETGAERVDMYRLYPETLIQYTPNVLDRCFQEDPNTRSVNAEMAYMSLRLASKWRENQKHLNPICSRTPRKELPAPLSFLVSLLKDFFS